MFVLVEKVIRHFAATETVLIFETLQKHGPTDSHCCERAKPPPAIPALTCSTKDSRSARAFFRTSTCSNQKKKYANVSFHRNMDGHGQPLDSLAPSVNHFIPLCHAEEACSHRLESVGAWRSSSQRLPKESNFNISSMRSSPQTKPGTPCLPVRGGVLKRYGVELAKRRTQNCQFRALLGMESSHGKVRVHSGLRDNDTQQ